VRHRANASGYARLLLRATRKVEPLAVGRNRFRRQAREVFAAELAALPEADFCIWLRSRCARGDWPAARAELRRLLLASSK